MDSDFVAAVTHRVLRQRLASRAQYNEAISHFAAGRRPNANSTL
jgi:hypothetical protein